MCIEIVGSEVYMQRGKKVKELGPTWPSAVNTHSGMEAGSSLG